MTTTTQHEAGLRIAEVARRTGFSTATLRYYDEIGLLPSPRRSEAGYRLYDSQALDRLAFITRAKELGCSLEEIGELIPAWAGDDCAPVQRRLHELVVTKLAETRERIESLVEFTEDLEAMSAVLEGPAAGGACGPDCPCGSTPLPPGKQRSTPQPVELPAVPGLSGYPSASIACSLSSTDLSGRLDEWQALLAQAEARLPMADGLRLRFPADVDATEVVRLARAEQTCCRFFSFAITVDDRGIGLEVTAPTDGEDVLSVLFGAPA